MAAKLQKQKIDCPVHVDWLKPDESNSIAAQEKR
jgi:hypothetical protein